ncbi:hypothetical protein EJD97_016403, partial [Solanum chilense]
IATKYLNLRYKFGGILVSEVGPVYVGGRTEYVENVDEIIYQFLNFSISRGNLVELKNDIDICSMTLFMHDGDIIYIYVCDDTILDDVGPNEGQISHSLRQVVESFNAHGESLTTQPKKSDLGLGSSSSFPATERLENDGVARVEQETDDDYSSINSTDTEEEVEPTVQQGTEPSMLEEVEPSIQENAEEDIDSDSVFLTSLLTMEV